MMSTYEFLVVASGLDHEAGDFEDRLVVAGCNDATIAFQKGLILVDFDREARSFAEALWSAVGDVQKSGATVRRIEPDDLVSLADIARRAEMSRAAVSNYFAGTRGEGFPVPVAKIGSDNPLWRWSEVSTWLHKRNRLSIEAMEQAQLIAEINDRLRSGAPIGSPDDLRNSSVEADRRNRA
jgi:predicted DNA-binding transcriptional regulator AlpA